MANEKRLIDANSADVEMISCYYGSNCRLEDVQDWLNEQPAVDAVEVVRCRNCIWYEKGKDYEPYCNHPSHGIPYPDDDDFCSYGERRTDGDSKMR